MQVMRRQLEGRQLGRSLDQMAGCTCLFGVPCVVDDGGKTCGDWPNRFEVALRAREDKYDTAF